MPVTLGIARECDKSGDLYGLASGRLVDAASSERWITKDALGQILLTKAMTRATQPSQARVAMFDHRPFP